jgi:hypothetical protein
MTNRRTARGALRPASPMTRRSLRQRGTSGASSSTLRLVHARCRGWPPADATSSPPLLHSPRAVGLASTGWAETCPSGSEAAGAQQCAPATRQTRQRHQSQRGVRSISRRSGTTRSSPSHDNAIDAQRIERRPGPSSPGLTTAQAASQASCGRYTGSPTPNARSVGCPRQGTTQRRATRNWLGL